MAKKKNNIPSGFEDILGNIYSNVEEGEGITDMNALMEPNTPLEDDDDKNEPPVNNNPEDGNTADQDDPNAHEDNTEPPVDVINNQPGVVNTEDNNDDNNNDDDNDNISDADVIEAQQVSLLFDAVAESLGWNVDDINEEDKPVTVDGLTKYLSEAVQQSSVPEYADDRIQALDEFVRNGGRFEDFYAKQQEELTLNNIDLEDENNQKAVVRELMRYSGYTDAQINKKIERYEDGDMLYDEAEDALDRLKDIRKREAEEAAKQQEAYAREQREKSEAFYNTVTKDINELTNIRGIAIPKEDRKALFDYIFKVDQNGQSQYSKDFNKNISKNLIESAYFTMKADALISSAKKDGESSAAEKLRKIMRHSSKNHSSAAETKQKSATELLQGLF